MLHNICDRAAECICYMWQYLCMDLFSFEMDHEFREVRMLAGRNEPCYTYEWFIGIWVCVCVSIYVCVCVCARACLCACACACACWCSCGCLSKVSRVAYEWVMSHSKSLVTNEWVTSYTNETSHTRMSYITYRWRNHCTGWRRCIGCLKLPVSFRKKAMNYRALLRKMTYKDQAMSP